MRPLFFLFLFSLCAVLSGCSNSGSLLAKTMNLALFGPDDSETFIPKIHSSPYANIIVRENDSPNALLVLAWSSTTKYGQSIKLPPALKWISSNKELIVTQGGRVIKTINLGHGNLTQLRSTSPDPLILGLQKATTPKQWNYHISWQPGNHHNYQATSTFTNLGTTKIDTPLKGQQQVIAVSESVSIPLLQQSYTNRYWIDPDSGHVIKSQQHLAPTLPVLTITEAKPFVGGH